MKGIGDDVRRREDDRLVRGAGSFADDLTFERTAYAVFARSPHAHARIVKLDVSAARVFPGVLAVLTGEDVIAAGVGPMPHSIGSSKAGADVPLANADGSERAQTPHHVLPRDRLRFVGEAYAAVIAESVDIAKDAVDLIEVEWDDLGAVTRATQATGPDAPLLWDHVCDNIALEAVIGDPEATDIAFAGAVHRVAFTSHVQRVTGVHMEPRSAAARHDPATGRFTLHASMGIGVVMMRDQIAATLGIDPALVRVIAPPDVGGNFGTRNALYPEFVVLALAARQVGRPVKHVAERTEAFLSDYQGRDLEIEAELALDEEGNFLAFRSTNTANVGAYAVSYVPLNKGAQLMTSLYRVPVASVMARAALTNTPPTIPYRSAGRPEAMYAIERMIDLAARECGFDRIELRRRNMIAPEQQPYRNPFGVTYDNGAYETVMQRALDLADWDGFEERRAEARSRGRCRGIGFGNYIEGTSGVPRERAEILIDGTAETIDVIVGTQNTGQGHETAFSQLVGAMLGVSHEAVRIRTGDTDFVTAGGGSHSGRSLRFASIVFQQASDAIILRGRAVLADLSGRPLEEIDFTDGLFRVTGTNRVATLFELARHGEDDSLLPEALRGPFRAVADLITPGLAFPYGAAVCEIEIDPETGEWDIQRYTSVDDVGRALNPMIVHGQTHGGIVQGAGQALLEWSRFDDDSGQALSASMMDYALARASDFPSFVTDVSEVPSINHPMGFRPGGEGGTTPALGVTINAVVDALAHLDVRHVEMPATPMRIWQAIQDAQGSLKDNGGTGQ
ncbi:xanthine dehydrogenase family protein molybdopterin-binding subunit [Oryzicola mucosus]|uniref:Xanthine dehydrogenase family protein molybdopterin-binding subunit n=1 Tax=Oryzicola mucosus TaxID=2767425 RepID=A0A8J6PVU0_9HYPH|nr:xanthine dehydrogenase family protein molybdopterin-binding subunit [Oryzicola mucosus]MBD0416999.1 xanthine dehydrogenase family protein molybdopterin-binding subunit [Oryzicola mucosus]